MRLCLSRLDLSGCLLVQPAEIRLPGNSNRSREHGPELRRHECETDGLNSRPHFDAGQQTGRHGYLEPLPRLTERCAAEYRLDAEEVCIEQWCEKDLVNAHFGENRKGS